MARPARKIAGYAQLGIVEDLEVSLRAIRMLVLSPRGTLPSVLGQIASCSRLGSVVYVMIGEMASSGVQRTGWPSRPSWQYQFRGHGAHQRLGNFISVLLLAFFGITDRRR